MVKLYNLARVYTSTTGTGTVTLGAAVPSCITFLQAGVQEGETVSYGIRDGVNSEVGRGVYLSGTLTRGPITSTNNNAAINLSGAAEVFISVVAQDFDHTQLLNIGTNTHADIDTALARLQYTSGSNTGDQDLSPYVTSGSANATYLRLDASNDPLTGDLAFASGHGVNAADFVTMNTAYVASGTEPAGTSYWDTTNHTVSTVLENGVILQNGQELHIYGKNVSGSTIHNGDAVSVIQANGQWTAFGLTDATNIGSSYAFVGLATQDILDNNFGYVTLQGQVRDINTSGLLEGRAVYVDPAIPGHLTTTYPTVPNFIINVGVVEYVHGTHGRINVVKAILPRLQDLSDVNGTPLSSSGQILVWNNTSKYFDATANINDYVTNASGSATYVALSPASSTRNVIQPTGDYTPLTIVASGSQTASLMDLIDSSGSYVVDVSGTGKVGIGTVADSTALLKLDETFVSPASTTTINGLMSTVTMDPPANVTTTMRAIRSVAQTTSGSIAVGSLYGISANALTTVTKTGTSPYGTAGLYGLYGQAASTGGGSVNGLYGVYSQATNNSSGTVNNFFNFYGTSSNTTSGSITNAYGVYLANTNSAYTANSYGIYLEARTAYTSNAFGIYTNAGYNRFGDALQIVGSQDTNQLQIRARTTVTKNNSFVAVTSNVVTVTTSTAHTFRVGEPIAISGATTLAAINGTRTVTAVPTTTTYTFALTTADLATTAETGTSVVAQTTSVVKVIENDTFQALFEVTRDSRVGLGSAANTIATIASQVTVGDNAAAEYYYFYLYPFWRPTNDVAKLFSGTDTNVNVDDTNATGALTGYYYGGRFKAIARNATRKISNIYGGEFTVTVVGRLAASAGIANSYSGNFTLSTSYGTIDNAYLVYAASPTGAGLVTNLYGLYIAAMSKGGTLNYAIYTNAGLNRLGDQLAVVGSADRSQFTVNAYSTQTAALSVFKNAASQTADLTQWQNSSASVLAFMSSAGTLKTSGRKKKVTIVAASTYTVLGDDEVVVFTANCVATLPAATGTGQTYRLVCRAGTTTVDGSGSETIKGELTQTLSAGEDLIISDVEASRWE